MRQIESEYHLVLQATEMPVDKNRGRVILVDSLFRKRLSEEDLRQLAATCDSLPISAKERSRFANDALGFVVRSLVDVGERQKLIALLSTRCPGRVGHYTTLEFYLAYYGRAMKDPILILGEAYSRCTIPEVRHDLAAAVRRGFRGLGIHGKDDADFVANAMKWYKQEKQQLVVNFGFGSIEYNLSVEEYEQHPGLYDKDLELALLLFWSRASSPVPHYYDGYPAASRESPSGAVDNGAGGAGGPLSADSSEKARRLLEGTWRVIKVTHGGRATKRDLKRRRCVIRGESMTGDFLFGTYQEFRIRFPEDQPCAIDLISAGGPLWEGFETTPLIEELLVRITPAIYELNDDTLRICLAKPDAYRRPTSFDTYEGSGRTLIVLKRPSMVGPVALGVTVALVVAALLFWPKWGLYQRWKRRAMASGPAGE
jgi:uncharacterized protein (TIGR03067 family)